MKPPSGVLAAYAGRSRSAFCTAPPLDGLPVSFRDAEIIGADILPVQTSWPQGPRISYRVLDQGDQSQMREFSGSISTGVDLIIEDWQPHSSAPGCLPRERAAEPAF